MVNEHQICATAIVFGGISPVKGMEFISCILEKYELSARLNFAFK